MISHIISAQIFDKAFLDHTFKSTDKIKSGNFNKNHLNGKIMATLFYEPSTRTRLSFESAMKRLGGDVISTENAAEFSSAAKGETLEDTIRVVNCYSDLIVLRHFSPGASEIATKFSKVPIINAGDGNGEHPTQALLDLYTIFTKFKPSQKITISMVGDLANGRTIHSLSYLLSLYKNIEIVYVSPQQLAVPIELKNHLNKNKVKFTETEKLDHALKVSNIIYQTRIQKERFKSESEYLKFNGMFVIDKNNANKMKKDSYIMHPLPRVNEIAPEVDGNKRAIYFEQVQNGIYIRMALLLYLFDKAF